MLVYGSHGVINDCAADKKDQSEDFHVIFGLLLTGADSFAVDDHIIHLIAILVTGWNRSTPNTESLGDSLSTCSCSESSLSLYQFIY